MCSRSLLSSLLLALVPFLGCSDGTSYTPPPDVQSDLRFFNTAQRQSVRVVPLNLRRQGGNEEPRVDTPKLALAELKAGNQRFVEGTSRHPLQDAERRQSTKSEQKPHTIVLSCSDSRVPPEIVFDQGIGQLFVVRTAGEVADAAAIASIEYAVEHLGSKLILVMGHHSCGAVKAALSTPKGKSAGSKDLDRLVGEIRPNIKAFSLDTAGPHLAHAVQAQVAGVSAGLLKRSKILREAVHHHHLEVAGAVYNLDSGQVLFVESAAH